MNLFRVLTPFSVTALLLSTPFLANAEEHGAHVHGEAQLQVAIDSQTVTVMLDSPMDSLVGFEHEPGTATETSSLDKLVTVLNEPETVFVLNAEAGCTKQSIKLESPLLKGNSARNVVSYHAGDNNEPAGHSDLDGEFIFTCANPEALSDMTVNLFDYSANLQKLNTAIVGPRGQKAGGLTSKQREIQW